MAKEKYQFEDFLAEVVQEQKAAVASIHNSMTGSLIKNVVTLVFILRRTQRTFR